VAQSTFLSDRALSTALAITLNTSVETCARISGATWSRQTSSMWRIPASASIVMTNGTTAVRI